VRFFDTAGRQKQIAGGEPADKIGVSLVIGGRAQGAVFDVSI
jgi:hypothetical protein